ncbi:hypothetical protein VDP18_21980, partial [Xanthomonas campestris pv. campestris]|nr:hypothetical protein [Xanthomonas campestris pv. campestris]
HARTFFQAITSQVIDLPGGNVGKPQFQVHFHCSLAFAKSPLHACHAAVWARRSGSRIIE